MNEFNEHLGLLAVTAGLLGGVVWFLTDLVKDGLQLSGKQVKRTALAIGIALSVIVEAVTNPAASLSLKLLYGFLLGTLAATFALGVHGAMRSSTEEKGQESNEHGSE